MTTESPNEPDLVLAVSVVKRWPEVERGISSPADVILSAWSPWVGASTTHMHFDPDRIAVVVGCRRGETVGVFDVVPNPDKGNKRWDWVGTGPRRRIEFYGRPSQRYAAQLHAPAPTWRQGEGTPVKVLRLSDLLPGAPAPAAPTDRHVVLGEAVVTIEAERHLVVSVPSDYRVTVQTRPALIPSPPRTQE
ncbi:hypothetical protein ABT390_34060 [Streptomyces aurantiacus]|uniref:Uncharacterized protein n=1 Tax=Streptomyces aurantiacus JA 4570 TaxID=1286094 RepID=S4A7T5_9ACTN|nr:hypothetical protein [Streptomyces aurantiacus]EPH46855.1 hypothetical protein STRAU_0021 [Streptomyces aurantiacus JA 4570]